MDLLMPGKFSCKILYVSLKEIKIDWNSFAISAMMSSKKWFIRSWTSRDHVIWQRKQS